MKDTDYAYGVAYIRAIENRLLSKTDMENLITAADVNDAIRILAEKGYCSDNASVENIENDLSAQTENMWQEVGFALKGDKTLDILLYKNDFHNMKLALKGVLSGIKNFDDLIQKPCTVPFENMVSAVANSNFSNLPQMLAEPAQKAYDALSATSYGQLADVILDKAYMDYTQDAANKTGNSFIKGYVKLCNTLSDIKIATRCAMTGKDLEFVNMSVSDKSDVDRDRLCKASVSGFDAVIEYLVSTGYDYLAESLKKSFDVFEKACDDAVGNYMAKAGYISLGIEPIISYIYNKQLEIQSVRIIITAKSHGFDEETIRQKLRSYVA